MYLLLGYGFTNKQVYKFLKNKRKKVIIYDDFIKNKKVSKKVDLSTIKTIIVSPGINYKHPILIAAMEKNIPIKTDFDILYKYKRKTDIFVGVTGSNGKSTTVSIISFLLKQFNINHLLGGNIGKSIFNYKQNYNNKAKKPRLYILEISSYQAHYMTDIRFNIGTIINIISNHDSWHGSKDNYIKAKEKVLDYSKIKLSYVDKNPFKLENNWQINNNILTYNNHSYEIYNPSLKLLHNQNNLLISLEILDHIFTLLNKKTHMNLNNIVDFQTKINGFKGLEFRQEIIVNKSHIMIVNDSKSTNIHSSVCALNTFIKDSKKLILIMGGIVKGDMTILNRELLTNLHKIYLFGESRYILKTHLDSILYENYEIFTTLKDLVLYIIENKSSYNNHIIVFSPGGGSYDEFTSYIMRGKCFNRLKDEF